MPLTKADRSGGRAHVFGVPSRSGTGTHEVIKWNSGAWSCNCVDWVIRRSKSGDHTERTGDHCGHIKDCIAGKHRPGGVVYVVAAELAQPVGRARAAFEGEV